MSVIDQQMSIIKRTFTILVLVTPLTVVTALPCCPNGLQMIHINETETSVVKCQDLSLISLYKWCESFFIHDPMNPEDDPFYENEAKTLYSHNNEQWYQSYCTGTFAKNGTYSQDSYLQSFTGREVAMVCFEDEPGDGRYSLYATCLLISCVFLLATLLIYLYLPELRDLQGKCVFCFILSLLVGYLCLAYLQMPFTTPQLNNFECIFTAFLTYFWMMSAFFWLQINSFNMWRSSVLAHINMSERKLMSLYYLAGWGFPLSFLTFALVTHHLPGDHIRPNFGFHSCWFKGSLELWSFFYGPVLILLILNILYFISMAFYLWSDYRNPNPMPRIVSLRTKFCLYLKLFLVMGITWIFEIMSLIANEPWYVTDILNCFQGVIIFIVMVLLRKRVWRSLAAKKVCGANFTNCWERMEDEETGRDLMEDTQMSVNNDVVSSSK